MKVSKYIDPDIIKDGSIDGNKIKYGSLDGNKIKDSSIDGDKKIKNYPPLRNGSFKTSVQQVDCIASGNNSHAEGYKTTSSGKASHAEGDSTTALGNSSHAEGRGLEYLFYMFKVTGAANATTYTTSDKHQLYVGSIVMYNNVFRTIISIPSETSFTVDSTLSEGPLDGVNIYQVSGIAFGNFSHIEGDITDAFGEASHAEGYNTTAFGEYSHSEGDRTSALGVSSHAEGRETTALGDYSHTEGQETTAGGIAAHAEGQETTASGIAAHAEGQAFVYWNYQYTVTGAANATTYNTSYSHRLKVGQFVMHKNVCRCVTSIPSSTSFTVDSTLSSDALNGVYIYTIYGVAYGDYSHAEGDSTIASNNSEHAEGKYNLSIQGKTIHTVGIGKNSTRKNAHEIHNDGKHYIYDIGGYDGTNSEVEGIKTIQEVVNGKQDKLTAGTGISISNSTIACTLDPTIFIVVDSLPATPTDANINKIHLVKDTTVEGNLYSEYLWVNNAWEKLGDFQPTIDLSNYVDKTSDQTITAIKTFSGGINMNNTRIQNVQSPSENTDAVNKVYVDDKYTALEARIAELENAISQITIKEG